MRILRKQKASKGYVYSEVSIWITTFAGMDMNKLREMARRFR